MEAPPPDLSGWERLVRRAGEAQAERPVRIALVGKYVQLEDAYLSVVEALRHSGFEHGCGIEIDWVDSETLDDGEVRARLHAADGILIPGGFGVRGIEGKIEAARIAREQRIPFLGVCLGMQMAVADFARHVAGMDGANSTEFDPETPFPVIDLLPEQKEVADMGGTMRLGADPVKLHDGTRGARDLRRGGDLRAPPASLRGQQLPAPPARGRRARLLGHVAGRAAGRDHRDPRPPVLRRLAVPPRVQVAPRAARAAVPRVRRRRARARAGARPEPRRCAEADAAAGGAAAAPTAAAAAPGEAAPARPRRPGSGETFAELCRIPSPFGHERACADARGRRAARHGPRRHRGRRRRAAGAGCGNLLARLPRARRAVDPAVRPPRHRGGRRRRSSPCSSTAAGRTRTTRSSAPTTRPPWR